MNFEKHGYPTYYPFLLLHVTYMCAMFYVPSKRKIPSANGTCMMSYDWCFPTFPSIMTSLRDRPALFPSFKATSLGPNDFRECTILMKFSAWTWNLKEHEPCLIGQYLLFAGRSLPKYTKSKRQRGFTWLHHKKKQLWYFKLIWVFTGESPNNDIRGFLRNKPSSLWRYDVVTATAFALVETKMSRDQNQNDCSHKTIRLPHFFWQAVWNIPGHWTCPNHRNDRSSIFSNWKIGANKGCFLKIDEQW